MWPRGNWCLPRAEKSAPQRYFLRGALVRRRGCTLPVSIAAPTGWPVSIGYEPAAAAAKIKLKRLFDELIEEEDDLHPKIASLACRRRCAAIVLGVVSVTTVWATSRLASGTASCKKPTVARWQEFPFSLLSLPVMRRRSRAMMQRKYSCPCGCKSGGSMVRRALSCPALHGDDTLADDH